MLDIEILETLIDSGAYFSINENTMTVIAGIENRLYCDSSDFHGLNAFMEVTNFHLGDNLFNFLTISLDNLRAVWTLAERNSNWDGNYPTGKVRDFIASLDCVYLYLLYYSFNRSFLGLQHQSRLDHVAKEFEFALNFCCSDSFDKSLNHLTAIQRYYIYCQLYVDNHLTIDRNYEGENYLFLEPERRVKSLDLMPRKSKRLLDLDDSNEYEPVTDVPDLKEVANAFIDNSVFVAYQYQHKRIEQYLLKELFTLIKLDLRVKKCQNCGKYFILKGDYGTDYCDRIPEGEKFTCKKLAAIKTRKQKVKGNPILKEYEKAYKRMYARLSNHKLSNEEFRVWSDEASVKRDSIIEIYNSSPSEDLLRQFKDYLGNK